MSAASCVSVSATSSACISICCQYRKSNDMLAAHGTHPQDRHRSTPDVRLLAALADPTRLAIVRRAWPQTTRRAPATSPASCDVGQPTVSHHLRVLREAGVVVVRAPRPVDLLPALTGRRRAAARPRRRTDRWWAHPRRRSRRSPGPAAPTPDRDHLTIGPARPGPRSLDPARPARTVDPDEPRERSHEPRHLRAGHLAVDHARSAAPRPPRRT